MCKECREADPELLYTSRENNNLLELKEMMLAQGKQIEELLEGRLHKETKKQEPPGEL